MKKDKYIEEMKNVHASEELIEKTIEKIDNMQKMKNKTRFKQAITGTAAALTLAFGSVGAYTIVTGNIAILEKIGINLSKNYENNKQEIQDEADDNSFSYKGVECKLNSVSVDSSTMVMELDLKLDENIVCEEPNLVVDDVEIEIPSRNVTIGENFAITEKQSSNIQEDGTYKIFKYIFLEDPTVVSNDFFETMFEYDDEINVSVSFKLLTDKGGKAVLELEKTKCMLEFKLNKSEAINSGKTIDIGENIEYNNVQVSIDSIKESSFGNVITLTATEENIDVNKVNDIQKIDFIVKDKEGNELKIVSRTQNITMSNYKDGAEHKIALEDIQLVVDDTNNLLDYTIEIAESDEAIISVEEIKRINDEHLEAYRSDDIILTSDGESYSRESIPEEYYYQDEYGVYVTDKTADEIIQIEDAEPKG